MFKCSPPPTPKKKWNPFHPFERTMSCKIQCLSHLSNVQLRLDPSVYFIVLIYCTCQGSGVVNSWNCYKYFAQENIIPRLIWYIYILSRLLLNLPFLFDYNLVFIGFETVIKKRNKERGNKVTVDSLYLLYMISI